MTATTPPAITAPGSSPDPTDRTTYNARAYAWMQWLKDHAVPEIYADALNCYNNALDAEASANDASSSAYTATTAVSGIGSSVSAAAASAINADISAIAALASLNNFKGVYYGAAASNPTLDPLGAAMSAGDLYYNTAVPEMRVWNGSAWVAAYLPTAGFATLTGAETLTNKTLTNPVINGGTLNTLNGGALSGFKNKLRNYQFFVNQRAVSGTVVLAAGAYGHDGWKGGASGCTYTFSTAANGTTFTISAGSLQQVVEGNWIESGTYTLEWDGTAQGKINAGSYGASGAVSASLTGGSNQTVEFGTGTLTLPVLSFGSGIGIYDEWRPYPFEEMLCQLYYEKSFPRTTAPAQNAGIAGVSVAAARASGATAIAALIPISYKVRKRAAATQINLFNPSAANGHVREAATGTDGTATTTYNPSDTGFSVTATGEAGWTIGAGICQIHWESIHEL